MFIVYPWTDLIPPFDSPTSKYRMISGLRLGEHNFIYVNYIFTCSYWKVLISSHWLDLIYKSCYKDENRFKTVEEAKDRVDAFIEKLKKLKCFM